jgi:ribosomal RNA-processing protein 36
MSSTKRKALEAGLQRRVRAKRESSEELESLGSLPPLNGDDSDNEKGHESEENPDDEDEVCILRPFRVRFNRCFSRIIQN